jgi:predicted enzyme related to lactoylglutathione lyase
MAEQYFSNLIPELSVSDYGSSINFYVNVLGFSIEYTREEDKFAMISINNIQIMIEEINNNWNTGALEYPFGRGINFQIAVKNVDKMTENISRNGAKLFKKTEEHWYRVNNKKYGRKEFLIQDPDGYLLRFSEDVGIKEINYDGI